MVLRQFCNRECWPFHPLTAAICMFIALAGCITGESFGAANDDGGQTETLSLPSIGSAEQAVQFHGWGKIRLENISASQNTISGLYGEPLEEGGSVSHRFFLKATADLNGHFSAGARFRLSDEDDEVLLNGPVYFKNEYGSVFAQASFGDASVRLGYYDIFFTPLTLMRFDPKDSPEIGGSSGCGTCTSSGGLIGGSLMEDIDEELTFEGGISKFELGDVFDGVLLYARSQQAVDSERYRRHTAGTRLRFQYYLPHARDFFQLSAQYVYHDDDACSVDSAPSYYPLTNHVGGLYLNLPLLKALGVFGEWAVSRIEQRFPCKEGLDDTSEDGNAVTAGINIGRAMGIDAQIAYLYREEEFESLFSALTYLSNRQGGRLSASWTDSGERFSFDIFGKYLEEIDVAGGDEPAAYTSLSAGVSVVPVEDLTVRASWLSEIQERDAGADLTELDARTDAATLQSSYELVRNNFLDLKYQFIQYTDEIDSEQDYDAHILSAEMNIQF